MKDLKNSLKADAIVNLYRMVLFLAEGKTDIASDFLKKSAQVLSPDELGELSKEVDKPLDNLSKEDQLLLAEKALDQYQYLMSLL